MTPIQEQRARHARIERTLTFSEETFGDGATSLNANLTVLPRRRHSQHIHITNHNVVRIAGDFVEHLAVVRRKEAVDAFNCDGENLKKEYFQHFTQLHMSARSFCGSVSLLTATDRAHLSTFVTTKDNHESTQVSTRLYTNLSTLTAQLLRHIHWIVLLVVETAGDCLFRAYFPSFTVHQ